MPELVDDADDLRGQYFKLLVGRPLTQGLLAVAALGAGAAGLALVGPAVGAAALLGTLLVGLLIVLAIADSRSENAFFEHYAAQRGMSTAAGKLQLPAETPLLCKGDARYAERIVEGPLGEGVEGMVALFTYEVTTTDGKGNRQTSRYPFTIGMSEVRDSVTFLPELFCERKFGFRALEKLEDVFRSRERVKLESEALDQRYEIFVGKGQDPIWLRRFFTPTFIVWLTESVPDEFAFELDSGTLCCFVKGHRKEAEALDALRAATTTVATRLREESRESLPSLET